MFGRAPTLAVLGGLLLVACGGPTQATIATFPSTPTAVSQLRQGKADAVVGDYPVMAHHARESTGTLQVAGNQFDTATFGIGLSKDAPQLKAALENALSQTMQDQTYINILRDWGIHLGKVDTAPAAPPMPPKEEIVQLRDGKLHVGVEMNFPPMEFYDELKKEAGADVQLAKAIAKVLDVEIEFVNLDFDALIGAVESGQVDVAISSITITDERSQRVDFIPYLEAGSGILVNMGNPAQIQKPKDLCGKRVALQEGTAQVDLIRGLKCGEE